MKNMNDGITSFKFSKGPKSYKLKRDKVPIIPFCPSPQEVKQDSRRAKGAPRRGARSRKRQESIPVPVEGLEDEATARQYTTKASVPAYSELTAAARLLRPSYASRPRRRRGAPRWRAWRGWPSAGRVADGGAVRSVEVGVGI